MRSSVRGDFAAQAIESGTEFIAHGRPAQDLPSWLFDHARSPDRIVSHVRSMEAARDLSSCVALGDELYSTVLDENRRSGEHVVRWWCFVPDISAIVAKGLDRYMALNMGRLAAHERFNCTNGAVAAASCVGHAGDMLVLHALVSQSKVVPFENARQTPAWQYSPAFGPSPPSFARAVRRGGADGAVIVSGTASVRGEETVHVGEFAEQCEETRVNLRFIVDRARPGAGLDDVTHARIYVSQRSSLAQARAEFAALGASREFLVAPLCRRELLVEIEAFVAARGGDA